MKRVIALNLICSLLFQTVSPAFAQTAEQRRAQERQCSVKNMLYNEDHKAWSSIDCIYTVIATIQMSNGKYQQDKKAVITVGNVTHRLTKRVQNLLREGKIDEASALANAVNELGNQFPNLKTSHLCVDERGNEIPCKDKNRETQRDKENSAASIGISKGSGSANMPDFGEFSGAVTTDADMQAKILRLSKMDKEELSRAISVMAAKGTDDPDESEYVHPAIINSAFMFLADKVSASEKGYLTKYLDDKYPEWVVSAAANALGVYASEGKFSLTEREYQANSVALGAAAITYSLNYLARAGVQLTAQQLLSIVSAATEKIAVTASSPSAAVGAFIGAGILCVYQLNTAIAPMTASTWAEYKTIFWDEVFSIAAPIEIPSAEGIDHAIQLSFVTTWTESIAKIGSIATAMATTSSQKRTTCQYRGTKTRRYWTVAELDSRLNTGDRESQARARYLRTCLGLYNTFCPRFSGDNQFLFADCTKIPLNQITGRKLPCINDIRQLVRVNEEDSSFYEADTNNKLFTRAVFQQDMVFWGGGKIGSKGRWIPEAEIGIKFTKEEILRMFTQGVVDLVRQLLTGNGGIIPIDDYRRLRRGDHEQKNQYRWDDQKKKFDKKQTVDPFQHFHYEELRTYPAKNPYICNHSIFYHANLLRFIR